MAGNKYVALNGSGQLAEVASVNSSAGAADASKIVSLNAAGQIDASMLPTSGLISMTASENISASDLINVFNDAGAAKVRKADNTSAAKRAHGFAPAAITLGNSGNVNIGPGAIAGLAGLTIGTEYFLGVTGGVTATAPNASNSIVQRVGVAKSATELFFDPGEIVIRA